MGKSKQLYELTVQQEECSTQSSDKHINATNQQFREKFEQNSEKGIRIYGGEWLIASQKAIQIAEQYGIDVQLHKNKAFLTDLMLAVQIHKSQKL